MAVLAYSGGTTATITNGVGGDLGFGATITPVISGGVITSVTVTNGGQSYRGSPPVVLANVGGGSGATFTVNLYGTKFSKAQWFYDVFDFIKSQTDVSLYLTFFFENQRTTRLPITELGRQIVPTKNRNGLKATVCLTADRASYRHECDANAWVLTSVLILTATIPRCGHSKAATKVHLAVQPPKITCRTILIRQRQLLSVQMRTRTKTPARYATQP